MHGLKVTEIRLLDSCKVVVIQSVFNAEYIQVKTIVLPAQLKTNHVPFDPLDINAPYL